MSNVETVLTEIEKHIAMARHIGAVAGMVVVPETKLERWAALLREETKKGD